MATLTGLITSVFTNFNPVIGLLNPFLGPSGPPTIVASAITNSGSGATSVDISSSGRQSGDMILLSVVTARQLISAGDITNAGTFIDVGVAAEVGGIGATDGVGTQAFYKFSDGTETTINVADSGDHTLIAVAIIRGVSQGTPFNQTPLASNTTNPSQIILAGPTTTVDNCLIFGINGLSDNSFTIDYTNGNLTEVTERADTATSSGNDGTIANFSGLLATAGPVGNSTINYTNQVGQRAAGLILALQPG